MNPRELLIDSFRAALSAADPLVIVPAHLPPPPKGRTVVVGAGKAAAAMAHNSLFFSAREPIRQAACSTMAVTAGLIPKNSPATSVVLP